MTSTDGGRSAGGCPRPEAGAADGSSRMAVSVTRHAEITGTSEEVAPRILACNVDGLDLALDVIWGANWPKLADDLEAAKIGAAGTKGVVWRSTSLGPCLALPAGKRPIYRYHLKVTSLHLWLSRQAKPMEKTPNVLVSFGSDGLWHRGVAESVASVGQLIEELGGTVRRNKASRVDLCADLLVQEGLSEGFLRSHYVGQARHITTHGGVHSLATFYVGSGKPIQCRIYDKTREIRESSGKYWLFEVWGVDESAEVWRVEFQLRRNALRQYGILEVECLYDLAGGIWRDLTENWMALRVPGGENVSRRKVHPLWALVQSCADRFGPAIEIRRDFDWRSRASAKWYRSHIAGCFLGYAVLLGLRDLQAGVVQLARDVGAHWRGRDFDEAFVVKSVQLGLPVEVDDGIPI